MKKLFSQTTLSREGGAGGVLETNVLSSMSRNIIVVVVVVTNKR